ncbi:MULTISPECIES: hypothetical protein [unclassified Mucilaginibacter]|uniref:hypothetical protein n=1 Tax=unclassified Mucilaginibacter TaxID=2617802 RepID=UPI00138DC4D1|nr:MULTISPECIES: hypothetical protein [unclassified Mucilaginibacter]MBB5395731.1 hypothetical protein [Mucilaginibacter sp. AK015]QHS55974.1 hypothetical protein GWR56_10665 [Mucilaginibacter sp. 14171R-50]
MESSTQKANAEGHYKFLVIAILIGITGIYLRFASFKYADAIANVIFILGIILALRAVFRILK